MVFNNNFSEIADVFDQFTEFMAHDYASKILEWEEGMSIEDYFRVPIEIYNPRARAFYGFSDPYNSDEELKLILEQQSEFRERIEDYDPINQYHLCFNEFMKLFVNDDEKIRLYWSVFSQIVGLEKIIMRRVFNGRWKTIHPLVIPKNYVAANKRGEEEK